MPSLPVPVLRVTAIFGYGKHGDLLTKQRRLNHPQALSNYGEVLEFSDFNTIKQKLTSGLHAHRCDHFFDDEAIPGKRTTARSVESLTANFYIDQWLTQSSWSRNQPVGVDMPPRPSALPSPSDSFDRTTSSSRKSDRSTASVHDSDYRSSLRHRNIYINRDDPPKHLLQHAQRIIARPRASPEMDDEAVRRIIKVGKAMEEEAEDVMVQQFASDIIPAMKRIPDARLTANANQAWTNCVPLPLDTTILTRPPALPRPKPDVAFGYSREAFTRPQLGTIGLLVDDHYGRSYAVPDQKLHFPFLDIEFKSQAKSGTHYVATNQAAGAGALALQGRLDLFERSGMLEAFDYDAPQFFSVTMDHELARINVHWLQRPAGRQPTFHVEGLSKHLLDDADGIRAVARAIKNILDDAADTRLQKLCEALDAYRKVIVRERGAASTDATPGNPHSTPEQNEGDIDIRTLQPASPPSSPHTRSKMRQARPDADCTSYSRLGRASGDAAVSVHARTRLRGDRSARHVADPTGPASPVLPDPPKAISHSRHADTAEVFGSSAQQGLWSIWPSFHLMPVSQRPLLGLVLALLTLPGYATAFALPSLRPNPAWTYNQAIRVHVVRIVVQLLSLLRPVTRLSMLAGNEKTRFQPGPVGGTWYPKEPARARARARSEAGQATAVVVILHFHGGGYDGITAYAHLVLERGIAPSNIIVSGDSAGGNLALALVRYLEQQQRRQQQHPLSALPVPGNLWLWSPWLNAVAPLQDTLAHDRNDIYKYIHPLGNPFATSAAVFICAGECEIFLHDNLEFARQMQAVDGKNQVRTFVIPNAPHDVLLMGDKIGFEAAARLGARAAVQCLT
ncbi:hypothetical protein DV738_g2675, partial [Chaetothyriales sp. CBS 135597]